VWIAAYAQVFFSLSVALGILLTYPEITPSLATLCQQHPNATLYPHTQTIHDSIALIRHAHQRGRTQVRAITDEDDQ